MGGYESWERSNRVLEFREIGARVGLTMTTARNIFVRTVAKFIQASDPELPWAMCLDIAATKAGQLWVRELLEMALSRPGP